MSSHNARSKLREASHTDPSHRSDTSIHHPLEKSEIYLSENIFLFWPNIIGKVLQHSRR